MKKSNKQAEEQLAAEKRRQLCKFTDDLGDWLSCGPVFIGQTFVFKFLETAIGDYMKSRCPEHLSDVAIYADMVIAQAEQIQFDEMFEYRNM